MAIQFIDLKRQQEQLSEDIYNNIRKVLDHGQYIMGPEIKELEQKLGSYVGVKHAVACSSGTDALLMALMAYGVGQGDAIFTSPFTFISTAEVISLLGATPVFVDIDPDTFNIDPSMLHKAIQALECKSREYYPLPDGYEGLRPRGIIAVDLFGQPADYDSIVKSVETKDLFVIEDAAQSFGAEYKGRKTCSLADISATSFFPAKPLGCYGDAGMVFTDNKVLYDRLASIRVHGKGTYKYDNIRIGINGRCDTLQAAILLAKFKIFQEEIQEKQTIAQRYSLALKATPSLKTPHIQDGCLSAWAQYSIVSNRKDEIMISLKDAGIPTAVYYPKPLHLQDAFSYLGYNPGNFPVSEEIAGRIFSIPIHPYLTEEEQKYITDSILSAVQ